MSARPGTVGLLYARSTHGTFRQAHSGVARGLAAGLSEIGVGRVALIDCAPPARADRVVARVRGLEKRIPGRPALATAGAHPMAEHRSRRLPAATPIIALTSRAGALSGRPLVTFEDMSAALARRYPGAFGQSDEELARVQRRQAAMYRAAVGCCVGSAWAAESVTNDYGVPDARVHVVGRGHAFRPQPVDRDWSVPRFLFMGRDWQRKNGARVLDAFARVRAVHPDAELRLVGDHPAVERPGVHSEGYLDLRTDADRERLTQLFRATTCFVMPSLLEPFGLSYLEAASFGIPSIGTTVGGAAEAVGSGGVVVDPEDVGALANAMLALSHPTRARELGEAALLNAERFTWPRIAARVLAAFGQG
jgi:glycosyltransferase involved in cell wall biosynthesis